MPNVNTPFHTTGVNYEINLKNTILELFIFPRRLYEMTKARRDDDQDPNPENIGF